jgi:fumarate reductase subunit C
MRKPFVREMPATWWLTRRAYFYFMLRELTSVFIAAYCVVLLVFLWKVRHHGQEGVSDFIDTLTSPGWFAFHFLALVAAMYHAVTWFNLTPKVLVLRIGEERVPGWLIAGANYVLWIIVSLLMIWLVLG